MRILFFTHYFHPEGNAPATRVTELTRRWAAAGHDVTVVTGVPNVPDGVVYEGYRNRLLQRERREGVDVVRVWTWLAPNKGTLRRILNFVSYMATAALAGVFLRRPDVVIATSPQFFCGWAGVLVSRARRLPFVLEIRDLWPDSIEAVGAMSSPRLLRFLEGLERRMYAAATRIVTVGEGYRRKLIEKGVAPERIDVIPNGVDLGAFLDGADGAPVRERYGLGGRFVCAYLGTIGMGCGLEVVLRAARKLREAGRDDLRFLLVGDGAVREELEARAKQEGLSAVIFTGRQPKASMPAFLAATDVCLVHLTRTELFKTVLPSKIFEAGAMRKPIVLGVEGFAAELVNEAGAGLCMEPENEGELLAALERLAADPALARRLGEAGHERIAKRHSYDRLAADYAERLAALLAGARR
jgi:glycosyltransferase involved in cell wall biosynthesis